MQSNLDATQKLSLFNQAFNDIVFPTTPQNPIEQQNMGKDSNNGTNFDSQMNGQQFNPNANVFQPMNNFSTASNYVGPSGIGSESRMANMPLEMLSGNQQPNGFNNQVASHFNPGPGNAGSYGGMPTMGFNQQQQQPPIGSMQQQIPTMQHNGPGHGSVLQSLIHQQHHHQQQQQPQASMGGHHMLLAPQIHQQIPSNPAAQQRQYMQSVGNQILGTHQLPGENSMMNGTGPQHVPRSHMPSQVHRNSPLLGPSAQNNALMLSNHQMPNMNLYFNSMMFSQQSPNHDHPIKISRECPISKKPIVIPIRGNACTHLQCFDLESYLFLNKERSLWRCPVCFASVLIEMIEVDGFILNILRSSGPFSASKINIYLDGHWTPDVDDNSSIQTASQATGALQAQQQQQQQADSMTTISNNNNSNSNTPLMIDSNGSARIVPQINGQNGSNIQASSNRISNIFLDNTTGSTGAAGSAINTNDINPNGYKPLPMVMAGQGNTNSFVNENVNLNSSGNANNVQLTTATDAKLPTRDLSSILVNNSFQNNSSSSSIANSPSAINQSNGNNSNGDQQLIFGRFNSSNSKSPINPMSPSLQTRNQLQILSPQKYGANYGNNASDNIKFKRDSTYELTSVTPPTISPSSAKQARTDGTFLFDDQQQTRGSAQSQYSDNQLNNELMDPINGADDDMLDFNFDNIEQLLKSKNCNLTLASIQQQQQQEVNANGNLSASKEDTVNSSNGADTTTNHANDRTDAKNSAPPNIYLSTVIKKEDGDTVKSNSSQAAPKNTNSLAVNADIKSQLPDSHDSISSASPPLHPQKSTDLNNGGHDDFNSMGNEQIRYFAQDSDFGQNHNGNGDGTNNDNDLMSAVESHHQLKLDDLDSEFVMN